MSFCLHILICDPLCKAAACVTANGLPCRGRQCSNENKYHYVVTSHRYYDPLILFIFLLQTADRSHLVI